MLRCDCGEARTSIAGAYHLLKSKFPYSDGMFDFNTLRRETKRLSVIILTICEVVRLPARRALCRTANTFWIARHKKSRGRCSHGCRCPASLLAVVSYNLFPVAVCFNVFNLHTLLNCRIVAVNYKILRCGGVLWVFAFVRVIDPNE